MPAEEMHASLPRQRSMKAGSGKSLAQEWARPADRGNFRPSSNSLGQVDAMNCKRGWPSTPTPTGLKPRVCGRQAAGDGLMPHADRPAREVVMRRKLRLGRQPDPASLKPCLNARPHPRARPGSTSQSCRRRSSPPDPRSPLRSAHHPSPRQAASRPVRSGARSG